MTWKLLSYKEEIAQEKTETLKNFTEQELTPAKGYHPAGLWHQLGSDYRDFSDLQSMSVK